MFASVTAKVVTAVCAVVGASALLVLTITGVWPYLESGLALVGFAMFLVWPYCYMVLGPGRYL
jgi:hypothetical protein